MKISLHSHLSVIFILILFINTAVLDNRPREKEVNDNDNEGMKAANKRTQILESNLFKLQLSKFLYLHM